MSIKMCDGSRKQLSFDKMLSNGLKQVRSLNVLYTLLTLLSHHLGSVLAYFEGCDHVYQINSGYSYLQSPYYDKSYPAGTSCRYKFVAPLDYDITINCTININKGPNACSTEFFYIARDGDEYLRDSEQFCGAGTFVRKSIFRSAVLAYISHGSWGNFRCQLYAKPQACDCGWSVNTKITNGQETAINEYPSMVGLKRTNDTYPFCSGAIISHNHILTAAHCTRQVPKASEIIALVGDHNLASNSETKYAAKYTIAQIIEHPYYVSYPTNNDIALLRTTTPIEWSRGVGPICLPPPTLRPVDYEYADVDILGWGAKIFAGYPSDTLQKITVLIQDNVACARTYDYTTIYPTQMCTYDSTGTGKDSCQNDSGGPVIWRRARQFLLGCISFGRSCAEGKYATGVNTRISSYLTWINQNTGYSTCNVNI